MFGKKKKEGEKITDASESVDADAVVYFGGVEIGRVLRVKAKEIMGLEHLELIIRLNVGAGIDKQFQQVLATQGLFVGRPNDNY